MDEGYEPALSRNGDEPWGPTRLHGVRSLAVVLALLDLSVVVGLGGILLGFVLVLDPLLRFAAALTALPGLALLWRSFAGALRVLRRTSGEIALAWRRLAFGSLLLVVADLGWGIVAITFAR